jgi:putative endonuclease
MNWYVYIAQTKIGTYYTGITTNPVRRINDHNSGRGSKLARDQGGFIMCYISQPFSSKSSARMREIQIKKWTRRKKEMLIHGKWGDV